VNHRSQSAAYKSDITGTDLWPPVIESDCLPPNQTGASPCPISISIYVNGRDIPDEDGTAFPDAVTARVAAVHAMAEAIKDASRRFWDHPDWEMHVVGESGGTVCRLRLSGDLSRARHPAAHRVTLAAVEQLG
jgi:hypothetical protein